MLSIAFIEYSPFMRKQILPLALSQIFGQSFFFRFPAHLLITQEVRVGKHSSIEYAWVGLTKKPIVAPETIGQSRESIVAFSIQGVQVNYQRRRCFRQLLQSSSF